MAHQIFISLTKQDTPIAEALRDALRQLLGDLVRVHFSTSKEIEGGIAHGEDWFQWIVEQVQACDFAFILLTPASAQKPWILWEAGAVHGAAVASGGASLRKVRPLVFQIEPDLLPSPIRDSKAQYRRGDQQGDVETLFREILHLYRDELGFDQMSDAILRHKSIATQYLEVVKRTLLLAPMLPTNEVIEEWRIRLDRLLEQDRPSEVEHLHDWMDIAFGRKSDDRPQPLDLRIHNRLADLYVKKRSHSRAIVQLRLAQQLAPRDIFVLRRLGKALLDAGSRAEAKQVIDRILELDATALERNAECAALASRWYREGGDLPQAAQVLRVALNSDPESYYLANLLAEVRLEAGDGDGAREAFKQALHVLQHLREHNVWTRATAANAAFFLGDDGRATEYLGRIAALNADAGSVASIEAGLQRIAARVEGGAERVVPLLGALRESSPR